MPLADLVLLPRPRALTPAPGETAAGTALQTRTDATLPAQGYRLHLRPDSVVLEAADAAGAFYGRMTFRQLARQCADRIPCGTIEDWPDFPDRGVMLDISRDKVPTLDTLRSLIDQLAEWKYNHIELYTEHTFAYQKHPEVWQDASPMTPEEIRALDAYCRDRHIELVPNQNSFGHMARWLKLPRYRPLAECPDGYTAPWGQRYALGSTLDPTQPESLTLVAELYEELLPCFSSRRFNVGCDETFDLGQGRSREDCERRGKGRVYLDFLLKIHALCRQHGRTMLFWGDIILHHAELIPELPKDVVALAWGYEADHPFDSQCAEFARAGIPFLVCPGTSSWNSIAGRTDNCLKNLLNAAQNGLKHGAVGYLVTDWGDYGHWQYLPVSYLGFAAGAAAAWNLDANRALLEDRNTLCRALDTHAFLDHAGVMGALAYDLGNANLLTPACNKANSAGLFRLLNPGAMRREDWRPLEWPEYKAVSPEEYLTARAAIHALAATIDRADLRRADAAWIRDEFRNAARMLQAACDRALAVNPERLAADLPLIISEHRRLWLARNRPGGLQDSAAILESLLEEYKGQIQHAKDRKNGTSAE